MGNLNRVGFIAVDADVFHHHRLHLLCHVTAVVCFVLIGFYSYPFVTILFGKWPVRPSDLPQPQAGLAELGWCSMLTLVFYSVLIVPFWGLVFGQSIGNSFGLNIPWWDGISGISHVHWVFGWWEWMIIILFMTPNVWRMKPWTLIPLPQPWKGAVSFVINLILGYGIALLCVKIAPAWLGEMLHHIDKDSERIRFLWFHAAEIAGFTLIPFLIWHHCFDDLVPFSDVDSWGSFWFRTGGVLFFFFFFFFFCIINYILFYYTNFGSWALGNPHWDHRFLHGESLVWNFWFFAFGYITFQLTSDQIHFTGRISGALAIWVLSLVETASIAKKRYL